MANTTVKFSNFGLRLEQITEIPVITVVREFAFVIVAQLCRLILHEIQRSNLDDAVRKFVLWRAIVIGTH